MESRESDRVFVFSTCLSNSISSHHEGLRTLLCSLLLKSAKRDEPIQPESTDLSLFFFTLTPLV